jgi:hypothetical protein
VSGRVTMHEFCSFSMYSDGALPLTSLMVLRDYVLPYVTQRMVVSFETVQSHQVRKERTRNPHRQLH